MLIIILMVVIMCQEAHPRQPSSEPKCACLRDPEGMPLFSAAEPQLWIARCKAGAPVMPPSSGRQTWFNPGGESLSYWALWHSASITCKVEKLWFPGCAHPAHWILLPLRLSQAPGYISTKVLLFKEMFSKGTYILHSLLSLNSWWEEPGGLKSSL